MGNIAPYFVVKLNVCVMGGKVDTFNEIEGGVFECLLESFDVFDFYRATRFHGVCNVAKRHTVRSIEVRVENIFLRFDFEKGENGTA